VPTLQIGRKTKAAVLVLIAITLILASHQFWLPLIGRFLVVADPLQQADSIVVLGGGRRERVECGAKLFESDYAPWFIVTNSPLDIPGIRAEYAELMKAEAVWQGVSEEHILVAPATVETTYQEALAVRQLAEERGLRSLIVVTDPFHTRRARMAFRAAFRGTDINVMVQPVNESEYQADSWWLLLYVMGYR
jgi:uncharacterized SAM-binding protein YcdF (DUF218 family)